MDGQVKAIIPQGIVRNQTKIGVQDGQAEDIINLRCVNGSWRASGDGMYVYDTESSGYSYSQLYIHTNVYKHLLGVRDGQLWWFAEIENDGVSFTTLDTPVSIASVKGDLWITQTGHMLTIIDSEDDFVYVIFKKGDNKYIEVKIDANGKQTDRSLYPFGQVHFNLYSPFPDTEVDKFDHAVCIFTDNVKLEEGENGFIYPNAEIPSLNAQEALGRATSNNQFVNPFLVCCAIKLYDGSFLYASNPVLLYPRQTSSSGHRFYIVDEDKYLEYDDFENKRVAVGFRSETSSAYIGKKFYHYICELGDEKNQTNIIKYPQVRNEAWGDSTKDDLPSFMCGVNSVGYLSTEEWVEWATCVLGSDLVCSIPSQMVKIMKSNKETMHSLCVFVTQEVGLFDFDKDKAIPYKRLESGYAGLAAGDSMFFKRYKDKEVAETLIRQPFYLLKEYKDVGELIDNPIIDLTSKQDEGLLKNIVQQQRLPIESTIRQTYIPKVSYEYNSRLHIANYKTHPFFGYPIDLFHLHNHSVKVEKGAWFKGVLPNLVANNDEYQQFLKEQVSINTYQDLIDAKSPYFLVRVHIETSQGDQVVSRYIQAYDTTTTQEGRADFIEDLNPLLTYPDSRAKKMEIFYVKDYIAHIDGVVQTQGEGVLGKKKTFELKPHPYLNLAYYISPDLKPIKLADFENFKENASLE